LGTDIDRFGYCATAGCRRNSAGSTGLLGKNVAGEKEGSFLALVLLEPVCYIPDKPEKNTSGG
jgi:hypothetical protein